MLNKGNQTEASPDFICSEKVALGLHMQWNSYHTSYFDMSLETIKSFSIEKLFLFRFGYSEKLVKN